MSMPDKNVTLNFFSSVHSSQFQGMYSTKTFQPISISVLPNVPYFFFQTSIFGIGDVPEIEIVLVLCMANFLCFAQAFHKAQTVKLGGVCLHLIGKL